MEWLITMALLLMAIPIHAIDQAPSPSQLPSISLAEECTGVVLEYQVASVAKIFPFVSSGSNMQQPFRFQSTLSLINTGFRDLKGWRTSIDFQHGEWLTQAVGVILANGQELPVQVGNAGVTLVGSPQTDIKNSIETAGDYSKIQLSINLIGTEFGVAPPSFPLPKNLSLVNDGYQCGNPRLIQENRMRVCCKEVTDDQSSPAATTTDSSIPSKYLPREFGDLTISYDVLQSFNEFYWAQVSISNNNPVGRLNNWKLSWYWKQGEFIQAMKGAQTLEQDQQECFQGQAGSYYKNLDFSQVMNCQRSPSIVDLDEGRANDTVVGLVPFCCRNGTILPAFMDPSKAKSVFQLQVYKVVPYLGRDKLVPPTGFTIGSKYHCGQPRQVVPSAFPAPGNALHQNSAVASWEVTCNVTTKSSKLLALPRLPPPSCCVSFSAFYNDSVVPCTTCACGCPAKPKPTCDPSAEALLLPPEALLVPSSNRTSIARTWNALDGNHKNTLHPAQLPPCGDYCGITVNWHVLSDHEKGWLARMTILNWDERPVMDWFTVVELDKAITGFQKSYSFNGSMLESSSLFLQGKKDFEVILGEKQLIPGKAQSVLAFSKKGLDLRISSGDGFPSRVIFNGEECTLPTSFPQASTSSPVALGISSVFVFVVIIVSAVSLRIDFF